MPEFLRTRGPMLRRLLLLAVASASLAGCVVAPYPYYYPRYHYYHY